MSVKITFQDGRTEINERGVSNALKSLLSIHPHGVHEMDDSRLKPGSRCLFWKNEEDSENDDGSNAVAVITSV